jgi:hypothetical protein
MIFEWNSPITINCTPLPIGSIVFIIFGQFIGIKGRCVIFDLEFSLRKWGLRPKRPAGLPTNATEFKLVFTTSSWVLKKYML